MENSRFWDLVWITLFSACLAGVCEGLLPHVPALQLVFLPAWYAYWIVTRGPRTAAWVALWGGALLESAWSLPAGTCIFFLLGVWWGVQGFRDLLPLEVSPLHGLVWGVVLAPLLRLWVWGYSAIWLWGEARPLAPSFAGLVAMPASGALFGALPFALARATDFRVLRPKREETLSHAD